MRTIVITNQKGGCGKTTTALNLAAALAQLGQRVLIVDLDPQAHATLGLGYNPEKLDKTIYNALANRKIPLSKIIINTQIERLHLAPSNIRLAKADIELSVISQKEFILAKQLRKVSDKYDICIVDCPPSLGLLTFNALVASTDIIVPVQVHYYALEGLKQLLETVKIARKRFYPCSIKILGLLLTFVEERAALSKQVEEQMRNFFGELVFDTVIHRTISLAEAPSAGEPILIYAPQSRGAGEYKALAKEVIDPEKSTRAKEPKEVSTIVEEMYSTEQNLVPKEKESEDLISSDTYQKNNYKSEKKRSGTVSPKPQYINHAKVAEKRYGFLLVLLILLALTIAVAVMTFINNAPIAELDNIIVQEDTATDILLTAKDKDRDELIYTLTKEPSFGTITGKAPNLTYKSSLNYSGTDSIEFKVSDGKLESNVATVSITVEPVNDIPVADSQALTTKVDKSLSIELTGRDVDSENLRFAVQTKPANGTVNPDSGFTTNGKLVYIPQSGFEGSDSFTYNINDGSGDSDIATVTIEVTPNNPPVAHARSVTTAEDTPVTINLNADDIDGDTLIYSVPDQPAHGSLSGQAPNLTYTPNSNFNGPDSFKFTVNDGAVDSFEATLSITVTPVNDAPFALAGNEATVQEDTPTPISLIGSDPDGDLLTYNIRGYPSHGSLDGNPPDLIYSPEANYNGTDSFRFTVNDGTTDSAPETFAITITALDDPPEAKGQNINLKEDTSINITLEGSDPDGDQLEYSIVRAPLYGSLSGQAPNLTYTPPNNFNWLDSFTYKVNDGTSDSEPETVLITVNPANDPPNAVEDSFVVKEDKIQKLDVLDNDTEPDNEPLNIKDVTQANNGTVIINPDKTLSYTSNLNFFGNDTFTYTIEDREGETSTAKVNITVEPTNDPPVITSTPVTTAMANILYTYNVEAMDPDVNDTLSYILSNGPENMIIDPVTGVIHWTPGENDQDPNQITVAVIDSNEIPTSDVQYFNIKVNPTPPKIAELTVIDGFDKSSGKTLSEGNLSSLVQESDNQRKEIRVGSYVSFDFSDIVVPPGASIKSVIVYIEHYEQENFTEKKLQWKIGTGWPEKPEIWISIDAPIRKGENNDSLDSWDVTSFVDTFEKLDSFQLEIENTDTNNRNITHVDYIYSIVMWDWPSAPDDLVEYNL